jgi:hypothetical protein
MVGMGVLLATVYGAALAGFKIGVRVKVVIEEFTLVVVERFGDDSAFRFPVCPASRRVFAL